MVIDEYFLQVLEIMILHMGSELYMVDEAYKLLLDVEHEIDATHSVLLELLKTVAKRRINDEKPTIIFEDVFSVDKFKEYTDTFEKIQKIPHNALLEHIYPKLLAYRRKASVNKSITILQDEIQKIEFGEYTSTTQMYEEFRSTLIKIVEDVLDVIDEQDSSEILLLPNTTTIDKIKKLNIDQHIPLYTGIKTLDEITEGFQTSRVYIVSGITGTGKSTILMNLTYYLAKSLKHNEQILELKKKEWNDRIPVILYLSNENTIAESYNRLASIISGQPIDLKDSIDDTTAKIVVEFLMQNNIGIDVKYEPPYSINTYDIGHIIKNLERKQKVKVVALVVDYMNRLKSATNEHTDLLRVKLGSIVDELKTLSIRFRIPVITAVQLNRESLKTNEPGKGNVGESWHIVENADMLLVIHREQNETDAKYDKLKLWVDKTRYTTANANKKVIFSYYNGSYRLVEDNTNYASSASRSSPWAEINPF